MHTQGEAITVLDRAILDGIVVTQINDVYNRRTGEFIGSNFHSGRVAVNWRGVLRCDLIGLSVNVLTFDIDEVTHIDANEYHVPQPSTVEYDYTWSLR